MEKKNILVFPCGSEIGLEIHGSVQYSTHFHLIGASSVADHGKYVYKDYIEGLPFVGSSDFIPSLQKIIEKHKIDAIYPAMDSVITELVRHQEVLNCGIIASDIETVELCLSKSRTYAFFQDIIKVPKQYSNPKEISAFPIFAKPDKGYGSRGAKKIENLHQLQCHLREIPDSIVLEYLPGEEFTIDCFTDSERKLHFVGPRKRVRVSNGISVNTQLVENDAQFQVMAERINDALLLQGAWFFQLKKNAEGDYVLLEIASRLAGSSAIHRMKGVNFALLSLFDHFGHPTSLIANTFAIESDRALNNCFSLAMDYQTVYVDFDDCLIIDNQVNTRLIQFLYQCLNTAKTIVLISKHQGDLEKRLHTHHLQSLFHKVIHLKPDQHKYSFMKDENSIFIDDSFAEREEVARQLGIPVFAPDMVEALLD